MAKLILSFEGTVLKTVAVGNDRLTIGRKPDNDIQVDNLAVSGLHAQVTREGEDVILEDLHSTNGTIVNGQLITRHVLKNFDVIELGKHKLKFVIEAQAAHAQANMEKTMVIRRPLVPGAPPPDAHGSAATGAHAAMPAPKPAQPAAPPPPPPPPAPAQALVREGALQILSGPAAGRILDLTKALTKVGRPGVEMSVIARRPNGYFITHVEGATFPQLNGKHIGAHAEELHDQDTLDIAGTKMTFFYKP